MRLKPEDSYETKFPVLLTGEGKWAHLADNPHHTKAVLTATKQTFGGPERKDWPRATCSTCGKLHVVFDLLKLVEENGVYRFVQRPSGCALRAQAPMFLKSKMKYEFGPFRLDDGSPLRWFDKKTKRWKSCTSLELRTMNKNDFAEGEANSGYLFLNFQPYSDRK